MQDQEVSNLINLEEQSHRFGLNLIASENYPSKSVLDACSSIFSTKYAEGYPGARYYEGCEISDEIENLTQMLTQSDIVITSLHTRKFILNENVLKTAIKARRREPIFIIDTGVPGDVDPSIENLEDVFLFTLDDLERVTKQGRRSRAEEAETAWAIIDKKTKEFDFHNTLVGVDLGNFHVLIIFFKVRWNIQASLSSLR